MASRQARCRRGGLPERWKRESQKGAKARAPLVVVSSGGRSANGSSRFCPECVVLVLAAGQASRSSTETWLRRLPFAIAAVSAVRSAGALAPQARTGAGQSTARRLRGRPGAGGLTPLIGGVSGHGPLPVPGVDGGRKAARQARKRSQQRGGWSLRHQSPSHLGFRPTWKTRCFLRRHSGCGSSRGLMGEGSRASAFPFRPSLPHPPRPEAAQPPRWSRSSPRQGRRRVVEVAGAGREHRQ